MCSHGVGVAAQMRVLVLETNPLERAIGGIGQKPECSSCFLAQVPCKRVLKCNGESKLLFCQWAGQSVRWPWVVL